MRTPAVVNPAMTFRSAERSHDYHAAMHEVAERLERLLTLFVLLVLGIALLLMHRRIRIPRTLLPAWQPRLFIGRDRDPPSLGMLCVIRC